MKKIVHGSTFSGIGGAEVAAAMLGWDNAFHCEINPFGRQILDYYFPNAESYEDITKTDFSKWGGANHYSHRRIPLPAFQLCREAKRHGG